MTQATIGLIGLAVMGQNLALNLASRGETVVVANRTRSVTEAFVSAHRKEFDLVEAQDPQSLVERLSSPRRIILMVKAGPPVDALMDELLQLMQPGDVIVDGGNSHWRDTTRRVRAAAQHGISFVGAGISGGELGARYGPSIMPGGNPAGWEHLRDPLTSIAAHVDGEPCCAWVGPDGSGHFVKTVHNGIEYADMQAIAESYHLLRAGGRSVADTAAVFRRWASGPLNSFLIDITATILETVDGDGEPLIDKVLDAAAQKGTGRWTVDTALDLGQPTTLITEAVLARSLSALKDERVAASKRLIGPRVSGEIDEGDLETALLATKIVCYAQGFMLIRAASTELGWDLDPTTIASLWRGGCIIRAALLSDITNAFRKQPELTNLLLDPHFADVVGSEQDAWRRVVATAVLSGVPIPALSSGLAFYDGLRTERLPANLIQAQRDFFGAHTYERTDQPRGMAFHTDWMTGITQGPTT
ncbi:MAG: decarboxylating NADP(+)-dependent phosphogluconate dehydrogenase [Acidimicrobiia bacterium]